MLLASYPIAGLESVARFAERAHVSPPTVTRFITKLGFRGYPEFQETLALLRRYAAFTQPRPACTLSLHVRDVPIFDYCEALRPSTRLGPAEGEEFEEEG